jgi:hypothetical protein
LISTHTLDILATMSEDWNATSAALMDSVAAVILTKYGDRSVSITTEEMRDVISRFEITREVTSVGGEPGATWTVNLRQKSSPEQMELPSMGTKLNPGRFDCYARALPNEPMFTLLARDPSAPFIIDQWAKQRTADIAQGICPDSDGEKVKEAYECAERMRAWYFDNRDNTPMEATDGKDNMVEDRDIYGDPIDKPEGAK